MAADALGAGFAGAARGAFAALVERALGRRAGRDAEVGWSVVGSALVGSAFARSGSAGTFVLDENPVALDGGSVTASPSEDLADGVARAAEPAVER